MLQRRWRCVCGKEALVPVQTLGEAVTCSACRSATMLTLKNSHPVAPAPDALKPVIAAAVTENCTRCGRKFRGPWDQHVREDGTLCDICARQVGHAPQRSVTANVTTDDLRHVHEAIMPDMLLREPDAVRRYYLRVGAMTLAAAVVVAALLGYLLFYAPDSVDAYKQGQVEGLVLLLTERFLSRLIIGFFSLYLVLWYFNTLPNDTTVSNVLAVGTVSVLLAVIGMAGVNGFLAMAAWLVSLLLLRYLYDFGWTEFMALCASSTVLNFGYGLAYVLFYSANAQS